MLEELRQIKNPITWMIVAAATVCSIVTLGSAIAIGIANPETESVQKSAHKSALYGAFIAAGGGALIGLGRGRTRPIEAKSAQQVAPTEIDRTLWNDWRNFRVVHTVQESETPDPGAVLICISKPKTPRIVLDL
jgi:hypothetical protein